MTFITQGEERWQRRYFSHRRNFGTGRQLASTMFVLIFLVILLANDRYPRVVPFAVSQRLAFTIYGLFLCVFAYSVFRYAHSYGRTNMMLNANGAGRWSIHMSIPMTLMPWAYSQNSVTFIERGTLRILHDGQLLGLEGTIIIESHLVGDAHRRRVLLDRLRKRLPEWQINDLTPLKQGDHAGKRLGCIGAITLTWSSKMYRKKSPKIVPGIFTKDDPVGTIEIRTSTA